MSADVLHQSMHLVLLYALTEDQGEKQVHLLRKLMQNQESTLVVVVLERKEGDKKDKERQGSEMEKGRKLKVCGILLLFSRLHTASNYVCSDSTSWYMCQVQVENKH